MRKQHIIGLAIAIGVAIGVFSPNLRSQVLTPSRGITGVVAGTGLTGGGTSGTPTVNVGPGNGITVGADTVSIDSTYVQRRVGACAAGSTIQSIAEDGSVTCASAATNDTVFGSGYDGAISFTGAATITCAGGVTCATLSGGSYTVLQNIAATDVACSSAYPVKTNGFVILANGTLSGDCTFRNSGSNASGSTGGAGAPGATLPGGTSGGNGAPNSGSSASAGGSTSNVPTWNSGTPGVGVSVGNTNPGQAGTAGGPLKGGGGGGRGSWGPPAGNTTAGASGGSSSSTNSESAFFHSLLTGHTLSAALFGSSTGGGGGQASLHNVPGGGAGGAGGWVVIAAKTSTFTGTIEAKGGDGAAGPNENEAGLDSVAEGGGGGAGGGGGTAVFVYGTGTAPTFNVSGGTGGIAGVGSGANVACPCFNVNGGAGGNGGVGKSHVIRLN